MYIKSVYFKSFGAFHDKTVEFEKGLNIIRGDNEAGKSTTADLIKFVFYGPAPNEKKLLAPYGESLISGSVKVDLDGKEYTAVRTVDRKNEAKIFLDGAEVKTDLCPGEFFTGITTADVFASTVFSGSRQGGSYTSETFSAIENIVTGGDERFSAKGAIADLTKTRKTYALDRGNGGKIYELEKQIAELKAQKNEYSESFVRLDKIREELSGLERKKSELEEQKVCLEKNEDDFKLLQRRAEAGLLKKEEKAVSDLLENLDKYREDHQYNDRMPVNGDVRILSDKKTQKETLEHTVKTLKENIAECEAIINECNEILADAEKKNAPKAQKKEKTAHVLSKLSFVPALLLAAAVIFLICGILFELKPSLILSVCAPVGGLSIVLIIVIAILWVRNKNTAVDAVRPPEISAKKEISEQKKEEDGKKLVSAERDYEKAKAEFEEFCSAWKVSGENCVSDLAEVIVRYNELNTEVETIRPKYFEHHRKFNETEENYPVDDEHDIVLPEGYNASTYLTESKRISEALALTEDRTRELCTEKGGIEALGGPTEIDEKIHEKEELKKGYEKELFAIRLTIDALTTAQDEAKKSLSPLITEKAGDRMKAITDGKYDKIHLKPDLSFSFEPDGSGEPRDKEFMSTGTLDCAYLALRLSLASVMTKTTLPFILDESLNHLDDTRLKNALKILSDGEQVILFTVSNREKLLCEKEKIQAAAAEF